jgi:hypothetical protein
LSERSEDSAEGDRNIFFLLLADGMTKRNPHDRTVEDKKSFGVCQQKEVHTYLGSNHE